MESRVYYYASRGLDGLGAWLTANRPTEANPRQHAWIQVEAPSAEFREGGDDDAAEADWLAAQDKSQATVDAIAARRGVLAGKWLLFPKADKVNACWERIARAVAEGLLGTAAKVSTSPNKSEYCICVYTLDYRDTTDVWRVRQKLKELGFTERLYYKPDVYTDLDIYSGNPWKISASRYQG